MTTNVANQRIRRQLTHAPWCTYSKLACNRLLGAYPWAQLPVLHLSI